MTLQPDGNGNPADVQFSCASGRISVSLELQPRAGAWGAVLAFFGIKKAPPMSKRSASHEARPDPAKVAREDSGDSALVKQQPPAAPPKPFPILDLPFELLCEVIARLPPSGRYFTPQLGATCKAFRAAVDAVSQQPNHREEDAIARRIEGIRWQRQIIPMLDEVANAKPSVREWAIRTLVTMTSGTSENGRRQLMDIVLERAKARSNLWEWEVMRHFARHLPHTDTEALNLLTERAVQGNPVNDDERLARIRVLAQLAQRVSPNDLPGSVRRWESIYQLVATATEIRYENYLILRGLEAGLRYLDDKFHCNFNVGVPIGLMLSLHCLIEQVNRRETDRYIAACTGEELERIAPPQELPGTVSPSDPLRAYSSIIARPIPRADRLPSHLT